MSELWVKFKALTEAAQDDVCGHRALRLEELVSRVKTPRGECPILKIALTNACERDCNYCAFRARRNTRRWRLKPEELARGFWELYEKGFVKGLFLTSGVRWGPVRAMDDLLKTAEILRFKYGYRGYLHLKIMPGAEPAQVERAVQLADRVSVNLEAPNPERLKALTGSKDFRGELLSEVAEIKRQIELNEAKADQTTQFVIGAAGESDEELLRTADFLIKKMGLKRVYFSPFRPVPDTPFEDLKPESPARARRLYQASFLLRDYGFSWQDLPYRDGMLSGDPKELWARAHPEAFPVEICRAEYEELVRVPGIGPKTARKILQRRALGGFSSLRELGAIGVNLRKALPYITFKGKRAWQPSLF